MLMEAPLVPLRLVCPVLQLLLGLSVWALVPRVPSIPRLPLVKPHRASGPAPIPALITLIIGAVSELHRLRSQSIDRVPVVGYYGQQPTGQGSDVQGAA